MSGNVTNHEVSEPLDGIASARIDIHAGDGNMVIDTLAPGGSLLMSGILQVLDSQDLPVKSLVKENGQAAFSLRGSDARRRWFHFPWSACNGATEWIIHLNPAVSTDLTAHSDGGNLSLVLVAMPLTRVYADTGGGNIDLILPDHATNLSVYAKTGAGNVTVELGDGLAKTNKIDAISGAGNVVITIPRGTAVRIHVATGLGGVSVDPEYQQVEKDLYQTPDFVSAVDRVEIVARSGAGAVVIKTA